MGPNACNWIIGAQESHENALQTGWASNMTVWCKNKTPAQPFRSSKVNFMVNFSEFQVKYSDIWFNMGPNACYWIIGAQECHENALWTV